MSTATATPCLVAIFALLFIHLVFSTDRLDVLESLNDTGMNWIRDFVRHGKGSVSRLPFEEIFMYHSDHNSDELFAPKKTPAVVAKSDKDIIKIGGDFDTMGDSGQKVISVPSYPLVSTVNQKAATLPFERIASYPNRTLIGTTNNSIGTATKRKQFDFKHLAKLLQRIIDRRKVMKNNTTKTNETEQNNRDENNIAADQTSISENSFTVADLKPVQLLYRRLNTANNPGYSQAIIRNSEAKRIQETDENDYMAIDQVGSNTASKKHPHEMSISVIARIHKDDSNMKRAPLRSQHMKSENAINEETIIYIVREGSAVQENENEYKFVSSITLIVDSGQRILVDTGLATDINGRTSMLKRLSELDVAPPSIGHVVTTHGHPDHSGNTNDFPNAHHYAGSFIHHRTRFTFWNIFEDPMKKLTKNVYLLKTPGHTSDGISVLIRNTTFFGTVAVSGDVFIQKEDMKYPAIWRSLAINETQQEESRRLLFCLADHIIPGHGPLFRVTSSMKQQLNCLT